MGGWITLVIMVIVIVYYYNNGRKKRKLLLDNDMIEQTKKISNTALYSAHSKSKSDTTKLDLFNHQWDVERFLYEYIQLAKDCNNVREYMVNTEVTPNQIRFQRIMSVISAYKGSEYVPLHSPFALECLVSETLSKDKQIELEAKLKEIIPLPVYIYRNIPLLLNDTFERGILFKELMKYRITIEKQVHYWGGVFEATKGYALAIDVTKQLYNEKICSANSIIDKILILLLGDDFNRSLCEQELIEKYGYPIVTDEELHDMELEWNS